MTEKELQCALEGILFAAGEPVRIEKAAQVFEVDEEDIRRAAKALADEYDEQKRGVAIIEIDRGYQLCTRDIYYKYIQELVGERRKQAISNAAMEALAIVAYKQPVTRTMIDNIRGVNSDAAVNRLLEHGLIDEMGRLDAPGKPILYGTTQAFLRSFGLKDLSELPPMDTKIKEEYEQFEQITIEEVIK